MALGISTTNISPSSHGISLTHTVTDNPTAVVAGNQHWGHATSRDLYHWENQPIAIFATKDSQIFNGSAVIDVNNTSGMFPHQTNGVVAIYTTNTAKEQTQDPCILLRRWLHF